MRTKTLLLLQIFLLGAMVSVMHQSDKAHEQEIQSYENRLIKTENRYLAEKESHEETKLELAYNKRILEDKQEQLEAVQDGFYIGDFDVTYYTAGVESTGKNPGDIGYGITRSGEPVIEGYTIASDWNVLPCGTKVWIEGIGIRVVQDTGSAIKNQQLDEYVENIEDIPEVGRHTARVYVLGGGANGTN